MARKGLFVLLCAGVVSIAGSLELARAEPGETRTGTIATTLAVQTALQQGRDHLLRGNAEAAVYVLESQLERINGNREFLTVLRDAYRAHIKELRLAKKDDLAGQYLQRLVILDPGAALDGTMSRAANSPVLPTVAAPKAPPAEAPRSFSTAPAKSENDPFHENNSKTKHARAILEQAEVEFSKDHFGPAGKLFQDAHEADPNCTTASGERWGYCKLRLVGEQLNESTTKPAAFVEMEGEVRRAMSLSPKLEGFARTLLARIQDLRTLPNETIKHDAAATAVRHFDQPSNGWLAAESASFIVFHNQKRELAEKTIQVAERTRAIMQQKWFSEPGPEWNPKCEIYLYGTGQEYSQATSVPANSPGHSDMRSDNTRVLSRRIYLHCDDPSMIVAVLPHETTHVVLAGRFGEFQVPRWADEGVAVLSEPREKIERHLRNLPQFRQDQQLFGVKQLLTLNDYPDPRYIGPFYAQSVSVVEFLSREKGTQTFTLFLRDGLRRGYEAALREHYGFQDFNEFEQRWRRYAFNLTSAGLAEKGRQ